MIRPLTLLSIVAAAGAGLHVYNTKHEVSLLDRELRGIGQAVQEAEARTQALQAEKLTSSSAWKLAPSARRRQAWSPRGCDPTRRRSARCWAAGCRATPRSTTGPRS